MGALARGIEVVRMHKDIYTKLRWQKNEANDIRSKHNNRTE